jgi:hypothetical protein
MTNGLLSLADNIWNEKVGVIHVISGVFSLENASGVSGATVVVMAVSVAGRNGP